MPGRSDDDRRPRSVYVLGEEPDPRFSLANERTLLAWLRTALALVAAGVGIHAVTLPMEAHTTTVVSLILLTGGAVVPVLAWQRWSRTERALRRGKPLPGGSTALVMVVVVAAGAVVAGMGLAVQ